MLEVLLLHLQSLLLISCTCSGSGTVVIDHLTVSAQHAVLLRVRASYSLKDLNSTNGTQVNGDFVTNAELKDGDTIRFGSVTAVFQRSDRKP
jgi:pSer/pThr/pTyr-binding forkhead associated (FHA) protein